MKAKSFVLFLIAIIGTSVLLIVFGNQRPSFETIVTETHKQLNNLKNFKDTLQDVQDKKLISDEKYLKVLGFTKEPRLYPKAVWKNVTLPLIVTAASSGQGQLVVGFVRSAQFFLPNSTTVVYNLGLGRYELNLVKSSCNSSRCIVREFEYKLFPDHITNTKLHAYRPIIIQETLNQAGAVIWMDIEYRFRTGNLEPYLKLAKTVGIVGWSINQPTSSLTHPNMFSYFQSPQDLYYFHHMVEPSHLVIYNLQPIHFQLMLPWVQCALTYDCISPIGAQASGCHFDKKPQFRYSGCHRYDMSAFNIILGMLFNFNDKNYTVSDTFYRKQNEDTDEFNTTSVTSDLH